MTSSTDGWYPKPHKLINDVQEKRLSRSEYILLDILLHLENRYVTGEDKWFYHTDKEICDTHLISPKTLIKARRGLVSKGYIGYRRGYPGCASYYKFLIGNCGYYRYPDHVE